MNSINISQYKLWTACVTPFDASGEKIDFVSLERLLRSQVKAKNGVVLFGSTGEGISLQEKERRQILEFAMSLKLSVPIMVGVPSHNLYQALEWLEFCKSFPIAAYLMTTPIYTKPGVCGQTAWFEKLLDYVSAPSMLYNIPSRAGVQLYPETIKNLLGHKNLWAIKDSSGGLEAITNYKAVSPEVEVFCGDDNMMPEMAVKGASGLVSVMSNAWSTATHEYVKLCLAGQLKDTALWWNSAQAFYSTSNPVPLKALLHHLGLIDYPTVRLPLSLKDFKSLEPLQAAHNDIMNWEKVQNVLRHSEQLPARLEAAQNDVEKSGGV